jgi:uncharacterized membrane protein YkoI
MKSKTVLFASIFVTVFILVLGVGVVRAMNAINKPKEAPALTALPVEAQQQIAEREAAYSNLIAEANQRIETLNNQVTELQKGNEPAAQQTQTISFEKAAQLAIDSTEDKEALLKLPELVDYQGTPAYEVTLQNGVVYINAQTGEILFSSVKAKISSEKAGAIAGEFLGGMNPKYADIKLVNLNGVEIYRVTFSGDKEYIVFIDLTGNVIKAQVLEYTGGGGGGGGSTSGSSSGESEHEDEHEEHDDD